MITTSGQLRNKCFSVFNIMIIYDCEKENRVFFGFNILGTLNVSIYIYIYIPVFTGHTRDPKTISS